LFERASLVTMVKKKAH